MFVRIFPKFESVLCNVYQPNTKKTKKALKISFFDKMQEDFFLLSKLKSNHVLSLNEGWTL